MLLPVVLRRRGMHHLYNVQMRTAHCDAVRSQRNPLLLLFTPPVFWLKVGSMVVPLKYTAPCFDVLPWLRHWCPAVHAFSPVVQRAVDDQLAA
jgi:hypothetical protein